MRRCHLFRSDDLLPPAWQFLRGEPSIWSFNPALLKQDDGWIFAYRMVGFDQKRRIALCRLDRDFQIVKGSQIPFSDWIELPPSADEAPAPRKWFADPRLYCFAGRTFLYWNSGWHEPRNFQFLQEFDPDDFTPLGPPRELALNEPRQPLEKNWMLFGAGPLHAVYSITPHRILDFSLDGDGPIVCRNSTTIAWDADQYEKPHGILRGGAPPILLEDVYYAFCHSLLSTPAGVRYAAAVYCFNAHYPFKPTHAPQRPLQLGNPFGANTIHGRLNPAASEVIYPCGAHFKDGHFIISHGINDEHCAISVMPRADVTAILTPALLQQDGAALIAQVSPADKTAHTFDDLLRLQRLDA